MEGNKLKNFRERIRRWKPIHLCWLFEKLGLPIPKYFIGAAAGTVVLAGSRIANTTRVWQADEDLDVTAWTKANDFIFAIASETEAGKKATKTLSIRWRNKTEAGSFVALSGAGELHWSADTDLVNDNAVVSGEAGCTPSGAQTWMDGTEREGANDVSFVTATADYWQEDHWAIDCSGAQDGDEYEFELYNVTDGVSLGTCAATITMAVTGGVSITPASASAASSAVIGAIILGLISITPAVASAASSCADPTVIHGSLAITPVSASVVSSTADPSVILGSLNITPAIAEVVSSAPDPTVIQNSLTIIPATASVVSSCADPVVVEGGGDVVVTPAVASAISSCADPVIILGNISVTPATANAVGSAIDPTVILGGISITPSAASAVSSCVNPVVVQSSLTITPTTASTISSAANPTVILGDIIIVPSSASAIGSCVNPTTIQSSLIIAPVSASAISSCANPTVIVPEKLLRLITKTFSQFNIVPHYSSTLILHTKERSNFRITSTIKGGG